MNDLGYSVGNKENIDQNHPRLKKNLTLNQILPATMYNMRNKPLILIISIDKVS